jgi:hypothetical protein
MAFLRRPGGIRRNTPNSVEWARIPPLPPRVLMTDRDDGTLWLLSFTITPPAADGFGYVTIRSDADLPSTKEVSGKVYAAYEGPYLPGTPLTRLLIRGGYLGYELVERPPWLRDQDNPPIYARDARSIGRSSRLIVQPTGFPDNDDAVLGWSPETIA